MDKKPDFSGWATRANMRCTDGRIIMKDAFKDCDGKRVPLVWNHRHTDPENVLGHAILHNMEEGVRADCYFNASEKGKMSRELVQHGDITQLSIHANQLKEQGKNVIHGIIREVSLVLAGANPGAFIDSVIAHNADGTVVEDREQGILFTGELIEICHAEETKTGCGTGKKKDDARPERSADKSGDDEKKSETAADVFNTLTEKQQILVMAMLEEAIKKNTDEEAEDMSDEDEKEEETDMKHNVFDNGTENREGATLTHADGVEIVNLAKSYGGGSLRAAMEAYVAENKKELAHADLGFTNIAQLFPDYKDVNPGAPELLTTDQGWVGKVLAKVHKSPISRIRTRQADVRNIEGRRAKGYRKGTQKTDAGNVELLSRTTDPVTVYIRNKLDRDDIIDITDFDVVQYMYNLDRMNLNEELARQILCGDGRSGDNAIDPTKIRPILTDDELYCIHKDVDIAKMKTELQGTSTAANFGENYIYAEAIIQTLLYAREKYRGTGSPDFYCTPHLVNVMLLARDLNGRRIYDNINELKAALNVNEIITVEQFEGLTREVGGKTKELMGLMVNLADYSMGSTKGGQITHFNQFDINFNQEVSLLETRCSGALTRPFSAIALEKNVTNEAEAAS